MVSVFLGTQGMALLGSFRNFTAMIKSIATLGINNSLIKLLVENKNEKAELSKIYSTFFWLFLFVSFFFGVVIIVLAKPLSELLFMTISYKNPIQFFGLILPLIVINTFWIAIYNGLGKYKKIVIIQIISNILIFSFTVFLIWKKNIVGGLFSVAVGELLMLLVALLFVIKDKKYFQFDLNKIIKKKYFKVILNFSSMALVSAIIVPLTLIGIRNYIIETHSIQDAGIWDATNKLSSFYMSVFSSGLTLYYLPKLASLQTNAQFKIELKSYFKVFVPLFIFVISAVYFTKGIIINLAFTTDFLKIKDVLIWQLLGDLFRIMTLAFGYQIVMKSRMKEYFIIEIVFNLSYLVLSYFLINNYSFEGALMSYFYASGITFGVILVLFRKLLFSPN